MNSRERVIAALNHQAPDRVPLDLGATAVTGISAAALHRLRHALGLAERTVRVHEPYQMLGQVDDDMLDAVGGDVVGLIASCCRSGVSASATLAARPLAISPWCRD